MSDQDFNQRLLAHQVEDAKHHRETALALATINTTLTLVQQDLSQLKAQVLSGNGRDSLMTRTRLIEEHLRRSRSMAHWLVPTMIAALSCAAAVYAAWT